jgi:hypothetical protein
MSLESALDEERRDVLALLEGKTPPSRQAILSARIRAASPAGPAQSPVRSMLDVADTPHPAIGRHASIAGQGVGITNISSTQPQAIRSMLDPTSPPPTSPPPLRPAISPTSSQQPPRINVEKEYNFEILPTNEHGSLPKRVSQGAKANSRPGTGIFGSHDASIRSEGSQMLRNKQQKSQSPSFFSRTKSPKPARRLNTNSSGLMANPNTFVTNSGQLIDMTTAYRRLSDANLLKSGSALADLPVRKGSDPAKGEALAPDGGVRLTKDYSLEDDEAIDSSDADSDNSDDEWTGESKRGRGRTREDEDDEEEEELEKIRLHRQPKSLLAAAEDESTLFYTYNSVEKD